MKTATLIPLSLIIIALCFSCRQDEYTIEPGEITPISNNPETYNEANLTGTVTDKEGLPLSDVQVTVENESAQTDENGVFKFLNISLLETGSIVKIKKEGYFDGFKFSSGQPGQNSYLQTTLIKKEIQEFSSESEAKITLEKGGEIEFSPNSIVDKNGEAYNGTVRISAHWYDPSSLELTEEMPGDLRGLNSENEEVQLITYGMMAVELTSSTGEELQLASEALATLKFPISDGSNVDDFETIPTWHLDEETGQWIENYYNKP